MSKRFTLFSLLLSLPILPFSTASPYPSLPPLPLSNTTTTTTNPPLVTCFPRPSSPPLDPTACGPLIREFRTYAPFSTDQSWREGVRPVLYPHRPNSVPPFIWFSPRDREGKCGIVVEAGIDEAEDVFSWRRVVVLVGAILARCSMDGAGGKAKIGDRGLWEVSVKGYVELGWAGLGVGNGTAVG